MQKRKFYDPQLVLSGTLKEGTKFDYIVFTIPLALFEIVCIVHIPPDGEVLSKVFCKFKVRRQRPEPKERTVLMNEERFGKDEDCS